MVVLTHSDRCYLLGSSYLPSEAIAIPELQTASAEFKQTTNRLAALCAAVAIAALESEGAINLEYVEKKRLLVLKSHHMMVARLTDTAFEKGSLEASFHAGLPADKAISAYNLVRNLLAPNSPNPWARMIQYPAKQLISAGLVDIVEVEKDRNAIVGKVRGPKKTESAQAVPEKVRAQTDALLETTRVWSAFKSKHGEVAQKLIEECNKGIKARLEAPDVPDTSTSS